MGALNCVEYIGKSEEGEVWRVFDGIDDNILLWRKKLPTGCIWQNIRLQQITNANEIKSLEKSRHIKMKYFDLLD